MKALIFSTLLLLLTASVSAVDTSNHLREFGTREIMWKTIFSTDQVKLANCRKTEKQVGFHLAINIEDPTHFIFYCGTGQVGSLTVEEVEEGI